MPDNHENVLYHVDLAPRDGFDLRAYVVDDPDFDAATSYDEDVFAEHIAAWRRDEWQGVGVIVEASREGVVLGDASIWGSEYGDVDGKHVQPIGADGSDDFGYLAGLIGDAVSAARETLTKITSN